MIDITPLIHRLVFRIDDITMLIWISLCIWIELEIRRCTLQYYRVCDNFVFVSLMC